jgi:hypothetical protein
MPFSAQPLGIALFSLLRRDKGSARKPLIINADSSETETNA